MDIVVTIPKRNYAKNNAHVAALLDDHGSFLFWVMSKTPQKLEIGDRMHFVRHGRVEHSMRVIKIRKNALQKCCESGKLWQGKCIIYLNDLQYHETIIEVKGFQGFRYKWWDK